MDSPPTAGLGNLAKHIDNIRLFGVEAVVALNRFANDQPEDLARIIRFCGRQGVEAVVAEHYARGGEGAVELAEAVLRVVEKNHRRELRFLYLARAAFGG